MNREAELTSETKSPSESDTSGWPPHTSERRDFYHRTRTYPAPVRLWRTAMVKRILAEPECYPLAAGETSQQARSRVDKGISFIREIARILSVLHDAPRLGNKQDPVDELVYIILARKTREGAYQKTYAKLKRAFPIWDLLLSAHRRRVEKFVYSGGLAAKKTDSLFGALAKLKETFGTCTLDPASDWSDTELSQFLCSLPEIEKKSAYCIMMYSFDRQVFPVDTHVGRVLTRIGLYRELGLDLEGLDHKQLQNVLAELIPPNLRYSLHVNLLVHGREVCTAQRPKCVQCELRNFCATYRREAASKARVSEAPTVVDLFCGAGGLSEGFGRAGFQIKLALDSDPVALKTYWLNHPYVPEDSVLCREIQTLEPGELKRLSGRRTIDVLVGAPPCQGFSQAGFRSKKTLLRYRIATDERNYLFEYMLGAALELKPWLFLMENVPGMKSAKLGGSSFMENAAAILESKGGYLTTIWKLNAAAFGVPQERVRYFLVAARGKRLPAFPEADYQASQQEVPLDALPPVTLDEAIFDLPERDADTGAAVVRWTSDRATADKRSRRYLSKFRILGGAKLLCNHTVRYHNPRDLELYGLLRPGEDSVHVLERHHRADLMRYRSDIFDDKYARLTGRTPCKTIVAHLAKDGNGYVHPTQPRSITAREAARVQSFHDRYIFCGTPSDQWRQLGNAVPPVLSEAIARTFKRLLESQDSR